jgi:hypothetical protein
MIIVTMTPSATIVVGSWRKRQPASDQNPAVARGSTAGVMSSVAAVWVTEPPRSTSSPDLDPRVDPGVGDVPRDVREQQQHRADEHHRLHQRVVLVHGALEAEASELRITGIGRFFVDPLHDLLGLRGGRYQTLYHFTVGVYVEDARLTSLPAYPVERGRRGR